jgi:predicted P-loop ATPase
VEKCEYTTEVLKLFMLGAIARAYHPGCKFDYVPIIYGLQGCGKSTFCRVLAVDDEWFDDNFNTIEGDKASEKLRGLWMAELAELLATKKAKELESIKSFLTSRADNYRPPYERRTEQRKRVCVFVGTTNSEHFLTDRTGNRRFLPLVADRSKAKTPITLPENYKQAVIDVNNAWGEAMELFIQMNREPVLVLPEKLNDVVLEKQSRFLEDNPTTGRIQEYLDTCVSERVCVMELWEEALGNSGEPSRFETNGLHQMMQSEITGWIRCDKRQRCGKYGLQTCYERVSEWVEPSQEELPFK